MFSRAGIEPASPRLLVGVMTLLSTCKLLYISMVFSVGGKKDQTQNCNIACLPPGYL